MRASAQGVRRGLASFSRPSSFHYWIPIQTRWNDNDQYGHVNNVIFYSWMDTIINHFLIYKAGLKPSLQQPDAVGFCAESGMRYLSPLKYPTIAQVGLAVEHLGNSSVRYKVGIFDSPDADAVEEDGLGLTHAIGRQSGEGFFIHVFVDPTTQRPTAIPTHMREALSAMLAANEAAAARDGAGGGVASKL